MALSFSGFVLLCSHKKQSNSWHSFSRHFVLLCTHNEAVRSEQLRTLQKQSTAAVEEHTHKNHQQRCQLRNSTLAHPSHSTITPKTANQPPRCCRSHHHHQQQQHQQHQQLVDTTAAATTTSSAAAAATAAATTTSSAAGVSYTGISCFPVLYG